MRISIKKQLNENNMSRYELAKRIGVTYPTITAIYNEESTSIKFEILESICKELNCSPDEILVFDDPDLRKRQLSRINMYLNKINQNKSDTK